MRICQWKTKLAVTVVYLGIVGLMYMLGVSCVFQRFLGIACPGCGMTRALLCAIKLDFVGAFNYHSLWPTVPVFAVLIAFMYLTKRDKYALALACAEASFLLIFYVFRI